MQKSPKSYFGYLILMAILLLPLYSCDELCDCDDDGTTEQCPDPAVQEIKFEIVQKYSDFRGKVRITAVIKNIGADFNCDALLVLSERPIGSSAPTHSESVSFNSLTSNEELTVVYERDWNASSPNEGEFPPDYFCYISYDVDVPCQDCSFTNNTKTESGSKINALF